MNAFLFDMAKSSQPKRPATQNYLDITEVRDDVIVMKDGSVRAVILVSSVNFALKSEDEQQSTIQGYMQFLNSLDFPFQIVVQSRKTNIDDYIARMRTAERELKNELLRTQMSDYISFVHDLVADGEIMSKRFFAVVPYDPMAETKKGFWRRFRETFSPVSRLRLNDKSFQTRREGLEQRVSHILGGLSSMGLSGARLDTQSILELFYNAYNPTSEKTEPLKNIDDLRVENQYGF